MTAVGEFAIVEAGPEHLAQLIDLEAEAFDKASWGADGVRTALLADASQAILASEGDDPPSGFAIWRLAADEAEILTIGVVSGARRRGMAACLLAYLLDAAEQAGAVSLFLEVDGGNEAAIGLYENAGFETVGARARYYRSGADALIMQKRLISRP